MAAEVFAAGYFEGGKPLRWRWPIVAGSDCGGGDSDDKVE